MRARQSDLPLRYQGELADRFNEIVRGFSAPGLTVLDVGAGRRPAIPADKRPAGWRYVGLDLSLSELEAAGPGAYDEITVGDVVQFHPELLGRFDLIVSFQVFEHVKSLPDTFDHLHKYLKDGGTLCAQFSGGLTLPARLNKLFPARLSDWLLRRLTGRKPGTTFPAPYHQCYYSAIEGMLDDWQSHEIEPLYRGALYFLFLSPLTRLYVAYESWCVRHNRRNLAAYYIVRATR